MDSYHIDTPILIYANINLPVKGKVKHKFIKNLILVVYEWVSYVGEISGS